MKQFFLIIHIVVSLVLCALILLQSSKGGLNSGVVASEFYRTKRGAERVVFTATIVFACIFLITSVVNLLLH